MKSVQIQASIFHFLCFFLSSASLLGQINLDKVWETPSELKEPESVIHDPINNVLFVSNINNPSGGADGNGSIGKISMDGDIIEVEWVYGGMDAPKGMGLINDLLYVADLKKVVVINTSSGEVEKSIEVPGAGMLNDITIDQEGIIYVSDSQNPQIYRLENDTAEVWLENEELERPNGLLAHNGRLYMVDMGSEIFFEVSKKTKELRKIAEGLVGGDGIIAYQDDFIISNWNGGIWYVTAQGEVTEILNTTAEEVNAADIAYLPEQRLLLVPTFFANTLAAYKLD